MLIRRACTIWKAPTIFCRLAGSSGVACAKTLVPACSMPQGEGAGGQRRVKISSGK